MRPKPSSASITAFADYRPPAPQAILPPATRLAYAMEQASLPLVPKTGQTLTLELDHQRDPGQGSVMETIGHSATKMNVWQDVLFECLRREKIQQIPYVPDADHSHIIKRAHADPSMLAYPLTTEEEGVAAVCGAWLGGQRSVLLMQSSGVGNCVNMFSLVCNCRFPFLTIVTMRGEWGEFNPWQVPMGRVTAATMELMGISVRRIEEPEEVEPVVDAALHDVFLSDQAVAILLSQTLLGRKKWIQ